MRVQQFPRAESSAHLLGPGSIATPFLMNLPFVLFPPRLVHVDPIDQRMIEWIQDHEHWCENTFSESEVSCDIFLEAWIRGILHGMDNLARHGQYCAARARRHNDCAWRFCTRSRSGETRRNRSAFCANVRYLRRLPKGLVPIPDSVLATTAPSINLTFFEVFFFTSIDTCKYVTLLSNHAPCKLAGNGRPLLLQKDMI